MTKAAELVGRALDAVVAREVMGYRVEMYSESADGWGVYALVDPRGATVALTKQVRDQSAAWRLVPRFHDPSSAAMWRVVEAVKALGLFFLVHWEEPGEWCASFYNLPPSLDIEVKGDDPATATCRAAICAVRALKRAAA